MKYEFWQGESINHEITDILVGMEGTPLENRIVTISRLDQSCRISDLETGEEVKKIYFERSSPATMAVDKAQTMIAIGNFKKVTFFDTTNFAKVKEVALNDLVRSLAFNKRNDFMIAVTSNGEVHSFKF